MLSEGRRGALNTGLTVIIIIIVALIILVVFVGALRSAVVGAFGFFANALLSLTGGGTGAPTSGPATTNFTAYECVSGSCTPFSGTEYWWLEYDGLNYSSKVSDPISFSTAPGNYSFTVSEINAGGTRYCSNASGSSTTTAGSAYVFAGQDYILYFSPTTFPC